MNLFHKIQFYTLIILLFSACSKEINSDEKINNGDTYFDIYYDPDIYCQYPSLIIGGEPTLDLLTWNLERFPLNGDTTASFISSILDTLNMDIMVFQEIGSELAFSKIIEGSSKWKNIFSDEGNYSLAAIYNSENIFILQHKKILTTNSYSFAGRAPQFIELLWNGKRIIIINNHFKANDNDSFEDEERRLKASELIHNYITEYHEDDRVIILGDLNDELIDNYNVFEPFNNTSKYVFADYPLSATCGPDNWSYPTYPSHIDHILLSNEFFGYSYICNVQNIEYFYFSSFNDYEIYISDHRPVAIKIEL